MALGHSQSPPTGKVHGTRGLSGAARRPATPGIKVFPRGGHFNVTERARAGTARVPVAGSWVVGAGCDAV
jgi:hypothetical protein